jgi:hypothetical protein
LCACRGRSRRDVPLAKKGGFSVVINIESAQNPLAFRRFYV